MEQSAIEFAGIELTGLVGSRAFIDPVLLRRCIHDLLVNSMDACSQTAAPRIGVRIAHGERKIVIAAEDNGCGIARERWESVFHGDSSKSSPGGSGLAQARQAIESYSGKILVRESKPWEATVIEIEVHRVPS
jgi:C4-dicarboxylate-specific signal transduction histidine kinase